MPKTKTIAKKTTKKAEQPEEDFAKCYISSKTAGELDGSGDGCGESFWIKKLSATKAEVRSNCLCGLCVGDIIKITENGPSGRANEVVKVINRKAELYALAYTFDGIDKMKGKFPREIQEFIWKIEKKGCLVEGVVTGIASVSRPNTMTEEAFLKFINSGPMTFTLLLEEDDD